MPGVATAWLILVVADISGSQLLDHDALFESRPAGVTEFAVFLLGWQLMVVAMMLPASFGTIRAAGPDRPDIGAFLAGFGVVWTGFAVAALGMDAVVHWVVELLPWLDARSYLLIAGTLAVVGLWELSPMKHRCLTVCRVWLPAREGVSVRDAFSDGVHYGQLCVICDAGLMLVMFAVSGSTPWMGVIGLSMMLQRSGRLHGKAHRLTGTAALALGAALTVGGAL